MRQSRNGQLHRGGGHGPGVRALSAVLLALVLVLSLPLGALAAETASTAATAVTAAAAQESAVSGTSVTMEVPVEGEKAKESSSAEAAASAGTAESAEESTSGNIAESESTAESEGSATVSAAEEESILAGTTAAAVASEETEDLVGKAAAEAQTLEVTQEKKISLMVGQTLDLVDESGGFEVAAEPAVDPSVAEVSTVIGGEEHTDTQTLLGTTKSFSDSVGNLRDCLFTFTRTADNTYEMKGTDASGTDVYVNFSAAQNPTKSSETHPIQLAAQSTAAGDFSLYDANASVKRYLYFWDGSNLRYDRNSKPAGANTSFMLLRPAESGEESGAIPGYVRVTDLAEVQDGGRYLIAHYDTSTSAYYVLHPDDARKTSNAYAYVAKVNPSVTSTYGLTTSIHFEGVAKGSTSAQVGNTLYQITVEDMNASNTPFVGLTEQKDEAGWPALTGLVLSEGAVYQVGIRNVAASSITWSIADPAVASIDEEGHVTGLAAGKTTITAVTADGQRYDLPLIVLHTESSDGTGKKFDIYVADTYQTRVYASLNMSPDLFEVQTGYHLYLYDTVSHFTALDFFATPAAGYALTSMSASNAAGDYFALNSDDPEQTAFYTAPQLARQKNQYGTSQVKKVIGEALDRDCDGALLFTRLGGESSGPNSNLAFYSEKLPGLTGDVAYIWHHDTGKMEPYVKGETLVRVDDIVVFSLTVSKEDYERVYNGSNVYPRVSTVIDYQPGDAEPTLTETLKDTYFIPGITNEQMTTETDVASLDPETMSVTQALSAAEDALNGKDAYTVTYYEYYKVKNTDRGKTVINMADLTYDYRSAYSSGAFSGSAKANVPVIVPMALSENESLPSVGGLGLIPTDLCSTLLCGAGSAVLLGGIRDRRRRRRQKKRRGSG